MDNDALLVRIDLPLEYCHRLVLLFKLVTNVEHAPDDDQDEWRRDQTVDEQAQEHAQVIRLEIDYVPEDPIGESMNVGGRLEIVPVYELCPWSKVSPCFTQYFHDVGNFG